MNGDSLQQQTQDHYERFPFEFMPPMSQPELAVQQPIPFRKFIEGCQCKGGLIADVGCGPGRASAYLAGAGFQVVAVDLTATALTLTRQRASGIRAVQASNLELPFASESFAIVVSDGVIHHTPEPHSSFKENVRILKRGGLLYTSVYRKPGYYHHIYTKLGPTVRWLHRRFWGKFLVMSTLFSVYYIAHLIKSRGKRTLQGARNFFYDYIITPQATFHHRDEVVAWGVEAGLELVQDATIIGNTHAFIFCKPSGRERRA